MSWGRLVGESGGIEKREKREKKFMDSDNSVVIAGGAEGWGKVEGGGGIKGDARRPNLRGEHTTQRKMMCCRTVHLKPVKFH